MKLTKELKKILSTLIAVLILMGQISYVSAEETSLKIYYNFDDVFQNYVQNQVQTSYNGKLNNTFLTSGILSSAAEFNGNNSFIEVKAPTEIYKNNSYTITFWIKAEINETKSDFFKIIDYPGVFEVEINTKTGIMNSKAWMESGTQIDINISEECALQNDTWHYVGVTYYSGKYEMFLDGKTVASTMFVDTMWENIATNNENLYIGNRGYTEDVVKIDELKFLNHAVSESVIYSEYIKYSKQISVWDTTSFPKKENYPNAIDALDENFNKESIKSFPLNTDYEEKNEVYTYNYDADIMYLHLFEIKSSYSDLNYYIDNSGNVFSTYLENSKAYVNYKGKTYDANSENNKKIIYSKDGNVFLNTAVSFVGLITDMGITIETPEITSAYNTVITANGALIYYNSSNNIYEYNISNKTSRKLNITGVINSITDKDRLVIDGKYVYDPISEQKESLSIISAKQIYYNEELKRLICKDSESNDLIIYNFLNNDSQYFPKFLFSFDGQATWTTYKNGKWAKVSTENTPSYEQLNSNGMTGEEVNAIPAEAFEKLYENNTDVLTVGIAVLMQTGSYYVTPVVENIKIKTYSEQEDNTLYASRILRYSKDEYSNISTIFPVEDFPGSAECYYLFFIGNDWLYSYKNGKIVKIVETAPELIGDVKENWLAIKQSGMTQSELRSVPAEDLNRLMLNEDYANTEFGIIYVIKTDDVSTQDYKVDFKLKLDKKYFTNNENLTLKITLSGSEEKIFTPEDITTAEIEEFMNWVDNRQNGKGSIFYQINTKTGFFFVNYYMITGMDVTNEQVN